ncbi:hypothetical protein ACFRQM_48315 [Streptomyces sp. NPDC056831]|uniref:hypothetical protein n=1 Tax=Streptomyces sp. NPDC056831 TaxID=3345954 RepID=UPI0036A97B7C
MRARWHPPAHQGGTEHYDGTDWFDLSECALAPWGLSNSKVEEIRRLRTDTRPIGALTRKVPTVPAPPVTDPVPDDSDPQPALNRRTAVIADLHQAVPPGRTVTELRRCLARAEDSTHGGATAEENELTRMAADALLRMERGVGVPTFGVEQPTRRTPALHAHDDNVH